MYATAFVEGQCDRYQRGACQQPHRQRGPLEAQALARAARWAACPRGGAVAVP
jgi:hypothetical protein